MMQRQQPEPQQQQPSFSSSSSPKPIKNNKQVNFAFNDEDNKDKELQRKITLATEGLGSVKASELILRDRNRLSAENALIVCNYIIAMKHEVNAKPTYVKSVTQILSELSRHVGITKNFMDIMMEQSEEEGNINKDNNDVNVLLSYLDSCRKSENDDPLHKWIGTYNLKRTAIMRFFKWLYYPNIANPKTRDAISTKEQKPKCIMDIPKLKRREISCYKPSDLWTQEDDLLFLKWVTNKRDRCYHTMARDLSARPHEILNLKIKDIIFKTIDNGKKQYAEVLVNGKTGSRHIPLIQSIPYIKDWLADHPYRNNPN
jgi:hypothetical protein